MKKFVETSDTTKLVCALSNRTMAVFLSDEELESFSNTRGYSVLVVGDDDLARKLVHVLGVGRPSGGLPCSRSCRLGQRATHPEPT